VSFDLSFMPPPPDGDWDVALDAQEQRAAGEPRVPTDADRARFDVFEKAVRSVLSDATTHEGPHHRELDHEATAIQVSAYSGDPGEIGLSVPSWYDEDQAAPVVEVLVRLVTAIEAATGLVAYDPQAGGPFLTVGVPHAADTFGSTRDHLQRYVAERAPAEPATRRWWPRG
jgi:hypothetical protein